MKIDDSCKVPPAFLSPSATARGPVRKNDETTIPNVDVATKTRVVVVRPPLYKVFLLNDDYTPMEFVVHILETFFRKSKEEATQIMLHVHRHGLGLCGAYPFDIAETKVSLVSEAARTAQHPLQCRIERE